MASSTQILITGASGYVSLHAIKLGLEKGYKIRTTTRSESRKAEILSSLTSNGITSEQSESIDFRILDFLSEEGWKEALLGVEVVLHTSSPFPLDSNGIEEEDLMRPSLEGTERLLKLIKENDNIKKLIYLSSISAVYQGNPFKNGTVFDERNWTDLDGRKPVLPFVRAKTLTEKLVWEFDDEQKNQIEVSSVCPVGILGPAIRFPNESNTCSIIRQLLEGAMSALPDLSFGIVDVRDVVSLIYSIIEKPTSITQERRRYIASSGETLTLADISKVLKTELPEHETSKVPTRVAPSFIIKGLSKVNPSLKAIVPELGEKKEFDNEKAKKEFGWEPKSREEAIVSCARELIDRGGAQV